MSFREKIAGKEIYFLLFLLGLINLIIFWGLYGFHPNNDTEGFLSLIEAFRGNPALIYPPRYLNPLYAVWGSKVMFFVSAPQSLIVANIISYFGILFLMYGLVRRVFKNNYIAFISSLIMITTYPMIRYLLTQVQDIGAYFWFTLTLYAGWRWWEEGRKKSWLLLGSVAVSFGLLTKESGAMGALFVGMLFLLSKISWKEKFISFLQFSAFPFLTLVINYFRSKDVNFNSLDWFMREWKFDRIINFKFTTWFGVNTNTFNFLWLLIFIGLYLIIKNWKTIDQNIRVYIIAVFIPAFSYFAWPVYISRTIIISGWLFIPIASYAIYAIYSKGQLYKKLALVILAVAMIAPYVLQSTIRYAHLPAIIYNCNNNIICAWNYFWNNRDTFSKIR